MTDLSDAIHSRRSIRKYLPQPVPRKLVLTVLEAAGWAPSAHNSQPWRFIILDSSSVKKELAESMAEAWIADLKKDGKEISAKTLKERVDRFANSPSLILACLTMDGLREFSDSERQSFERDLAMQSLGAAMQNLLLAAYSKGLGACWYCAPGFCKETVREVLKIPQEVEPQALVVLGYTAESPQAPAKKKIEEYCFLDAWGKFLC